MRDSKLLNGNNLAWRNETDDVTLSQQWDILKTKPIFELNSQFWIVKEYNQLDDKYSSKCYTNPNLHEMTVEELR